MCIVLEVVFALTTNADTSTYLLHTHARVCLCMYVWMDGWMDGFTYI